jgi:hypothetical protein
MFGSQRKFWPSWRLGITPAAARASRISCPVTPRAMPRRPFSGKIAVARGSGKIYKTFERNDRDPV